LLLQFRGYKRKKCQQEKVVFQIARDLDRAVFLNAGETNILLAMEVSEIHGLLFFFFTIAEEPRTLVGISFSLSLKPASPMSIGHKSYQACHDAISARTIWDEPPPLFFFVPWCRVN
jgi:hypothetical protein